MTADAARLADYVETWKTAVDDVVALLRDLDEDDWTRPTDLPGWDVRSIACHLAHLESELSGVKQQRVELPERDHLTASSSRYTELGLVARADVTGPAVTDELEQAAANRYAALRADPPTDPDGDPPRTPGKVGWSWETLLRNRVVDVWMHEQDIRRAVDRPGGMTTPAARTTVGSFVQSFPFVVGKKVAPPAGTTVALEVTGVSPVRLTVRVGGSGRAEVVGDDAAPDATVTVDLASYVVLAGGRRTVDTVDATVSGDRDLGRRVLESLAVTP